MLTFDGALRGPVGVGRAILPPAMDSSAELR
jgi:hypothetical protein